MNIAAATSSAPAIATLAADLPTHALTEAQPAPGLRWFTLEQVARAISYWSAVKPTESHVLCHETSILAEVLSDMWYFHRDRVDQASVSAAQYLAMHGAQMGATAPIPAAQPAALAVHALARQCAALLRERCKDDQFVIWRMPQRWYSDQGALAGHLESMNVVQLAAQFHYDIVTDLNHAAIVRSVPPALWPGAAR